MPRAILWIALALLGCAVAACSARPAAGTGPTRVAERFRMHAATLQEVADPGGKPLLVLWSPEGGTRVFWVAPETAVSRDGRPAALGDLRVGDLVELWTVHGADVAVEVKSRSP